MCPVPDVELHDNLSSESQVVPREHANMTKPAAAFRNLKKKSCC